MTYTNVYMRGNTIFVRGSKDGQRYSEKVDFQPTLWTTAKKTHAITSEWKTLDGKTVYPINPGSIRDCKDFLSQYGEVEGFPIYDTPGYIYQYIAEKYPGEVKWHPEDVVVYNYDIETSVDAGFPDPELAREQILLITVKDTKKRDIISWGTVEAKSNRQEVAYRKFNNEKSMLMDFITWWQQNCPDVISGWNVSLFDNTYMYNRMCIVLGDTLANKLSPWGQVFQREVEFSGRKSTKTSFAGISTLDYLDLYKKFTFVTRESYKLDHIAEVEIGQRKTENPGATFKEFYEKHPQVFFEYNVRDVELVDRLDDKLKLMDLALTVAYDAKVNFEDVFSPVKTWDVIIYNYLNDKKVVVPQRKNNHKEGTFEGAYVKDPIVGKHKWVASFDVNSMYPMILIQHNMSPETIIDERRDVTLNQLLDKSFDTSTLHSNVTMAASGQCFSKDRRGLMPTLAQHYYDMRLITKKQMIGLKQQLESINAEKARRGLV